VHHVISKAKILAHLQTKILPARHISTKETTSTHAFVNAQYQPELASLTYKTWDRPIVPYTICTQAITLWHQGEKNKEHLNRILINTKTVPLVSPNFSLTVDGQTNVFIKPWIACSISSSIFKYSTLKYLNIL